MAIVANLPDDQRKIYADKAHRLAVCANELATALRGTDDQDVLVCMALTGLSGGFINDLRVAFEKAVHVEIPDSLDN